MKRIIHSKRLLGFLCLFSISLFSQNAFSQEKKEITKIFLVRHAEKQKDQGKNPALTDQGIKRSQALEKLLTKVDFSAIYSTDFKRTRDTAKPLATSKGINIELYNPMDSRNFLDGILSKHKGKNIFVVGHSNTIPLLVNTLLGEEKFSSLRDDEYSNLFIVTIVHGTDSEVIQLTFDP